MHINSFYLYYYYENVQINYSTRVKMTQDKNNELQDVKSTQVKNDLSKQIDENLLKKTKTLMKSVNPRVKEQQEKLKTFIDPYTPKPYGSKKTYPQEWSFYQKSRGREKLNTFAIVNDSVEHLNIPYNYKGNGRPPADLNDICKSLLIGAFSNYSSWELESELRIAKSLGIITKVPARSTLNRYLQNPIITTYLHKLCKLIAEPLAPLEHSFIIDASGISNSYGNKRWRDIRHKKEEAKERRKYSKLHIMCGEKTKIISATAITDGNRHENPLLIPLLNETSKIFKIKKVLADAGYLSQRNAKAIASIGAVPFIRTKKNVHTPMKGVSSPFGDMLRKQKLTPLDFAREYNKRAIVESVFSSFKRTKTSFCRAKLSTSQQNEILSKIVCHNAGILGKWLLRQDLKCKFLE